jgi:hypothetical protein
LVIGAVSMVLADSPWPGVNSSARTEALSRAARPA